MTSTLTRRAWMRGLAAVAVAAAFRAAGPAAAQQTLKFGLAMPLIGSQSSFGKDQIKATEWAVADINAKGGVAGKKLEVIVLDTQADPTVGINAVNCLVNVDKAGVRHRLERGGEGGGADRQPREGARAVHRRECAGNRQAGRLRVHRVSAGRRGRDGLANYTYGTLKHRRVAVVYVNNDTGIDAAKVYRSVFEKAGGTRSPRSRRS